MPRQRQLHDRFFKQAKAEGYAARSAYKLVEIQERKRIMKRGDRVLDLGCAPGSWVQAASQIVGGNGMVIGVDLKPVTIQLPPNARAIVGDVFQLTPEGLRTRTGAAGTFDVVLSDMAPSTEGGAGGTVDHFRSIDLCNRVLDLAPPLLRPGGNLIMKVFEGEAYAALLARTRGMFAEVKGLKPEASRDVSREMYVVAMGFRPAAAADQQGSAAADPVRGAPKPRPGWGTGDGAGA